MARLDDILFKLAQVQEALVKIGVTMEKNPLSSGNDIRRFNEQLSAAILTAKDLATATKDYNAAMASTEALLTKIQNATRTGKQTSEQYRTEYQKRITKEQELKKVMLGMESVLTKRKGTIARLSAEIAYNNVQIRNNIDFSKRLSKADKALIAETKRLRAELQKYNAAAGQAAATTNRLGLMFRRSIAGITVFASQWVGITAAVFAFIRVAQSYIKVTREFGKESATLAGVLGVTRDEITALTEASQLLAQELPTTVTEITQLQVVLARLGYTQEQILALTPSIVKATIAWNSEVGQTAEVIGAVIKAYKGFTAANTVEITDKLAQAANKTALSFEKIRVAVPFAIGSASQAGIQFEDFLTILGLVNNQLISASRTGTSVGQMFVQLKKKGITLAEALEQMAESEDKFATALQLTNVRGSRALIALYEQIDGYDDLKAAINGAEGTINFLVDQRLLTLDAAIKQVDASWTALVTTFQQSEGTLAFLTRQIYGILNMVNHLASAPDILGKFGIGPDMIKNMTNPEYIRISGIARDVRQEMIEANGLNNDQLETANDQYQFEINNLDMVNDRQAQYLKIIYEQAIAHNEGLIAANNYAKGLDNVGEAAAGSEVAIKDNILVQMQQKLKELREELQEPGLILSELNYIASEIERVQAIIKGIMTPDLDPETAPAPDNAGWLKRVVEDVDKRAQEALEKALKAEEAALKARILWNEIYQQWRDEEDRPQALAEQLFDSSYGGAASFAEQALLDQEAFMNQSYTRQLDMLKWLLDHKKIEYEQYAAAVKLINQSIANDEMLLFQQRIALGQAATNFAAAGMAAMSDNAQTQQIIAAAAATINAFLAASEVFAQTGVTPVEKAIAAFSALAVGMGFVAAIRGTKIPSYAVGTEYLTGKKEGPTSGMIVEAHEGERIVPNEINKLLMGVSNNALPGLVHMGMQHKDGSLSILKMQLKEASRTNRLLRGLQWQDHDGSYVDLEGNRTKFVN